jgi:hypothetical protein
MGTNIYQSTGSSDWGQTYNWSLAAVPVTGDNVFLTNNAYGIDTSLAQTTVVLASMTLDMSYAGYVGGAATYLQIGVTTASIGTPATFSNGQGPGRFYLNTGTNSAMLNLFNSKRNGMDANLAPMRFLGSALTVNQTGGVASFASLPTETATILSYTSGNGGNVVPTTAVFGPGCKIQTLNGYSGTLLSQSNQVTPTVNIENANLTLSGSGGVQTLNVYNGGVVVINAACTLTTPSVWGTLDLSHGDGTVTCTNVLKLYAGATIKDPLNRLSLGAGFQVIGGTVNDVTLTLGPSRTYTVT